MTIINMSGGKPAKPIVVEAVEETPSTLPYTFLPKEGVDYLSSVTVGKDPNLVPENVRKDVSIFGVSGSYEAQVSTDVLDMPPMNSHGNTMFQVLLSLDALEHEPVSKTGTYDHINTANMTSLYTTGADGRVDTAITKGALTTSNFYTEGNVYLCHADISAGTVSNLNWNGSPLMEPASGEPPLRYRMVGNAGVISSGTAPPFNPSYPTTSELEPIEITVEIPYQSVWNRCSVTMPDIKRDFYMNNYGDTSFYLCFMARNIERIS